MASSLGINESHHKGIVNYMRFARYQRAQKLRGIDLAFKDMKDSRLTEDTFTIDEVEDMLDALLSAINNEMEMELLNTSHTNVLLLRQLLQQAETWHLKMKIDVSELENRELLEKIKNFEDEEFSGVKKDSDASAFKLKPVNESGSSNLLQMEIDRLRDENETLHRRLKQTEKQAIDGNRERSELKEEMKKMQSSSITVGNKKGGGDDLNELEGRMQGLRSELDNTRSSSKNSLNNLESNLTDTKHQLLKIRSDLELAEKELEKKVSQTAPFKNLKQMLQKKNDQIKELRQRLDKYEDS